MSQPPRETLNVYGASEPKPPDLPRRDGYRAPFEEMPDDSWKTIWGNKVSEWCGAGGGVVDQSSRVSLPVFVQKPARPYLTEGRPLCQHRQHRLRP